MFPCRDGVWIKIGIERERSQDSRYCIIPNYNTFFSKFKTFNLNNYLIQSQVKLDPVNIMKQEPTLPFTKLVIMKLVQNLVKLDQKSILLSLN